MNVGNSSGLAMSSRLTTITPIAPASSAAAPLSTNAQTPRWMTAIEFAGSTP